MHARTARRLTAVAAATTMLAIGASAVHASTGDDPKTTAADALARLTDEPFRFSADISVSMGGLSFSAPNFLSGEVATPLAHVHLDLNSLAPLVGSFDPALANAEWSAEAILAEGSVYLRGGIFALAEDGMAIVADEWGRIDLATAAGDDLDEVPSLEEVRMVLAMGIGFATGAEQIGTRTGTDGSELTGIRLDYDVRELSELAGEMSDTAGDALGEVESVPDVTIPIEVWIDGDGAPRELIIHLDAETLAKVMEASGEDLGVGEVDFNLTVRFDDVGDPSIAIKEPTGATDITHLL